MRILIANRGEIARRIIRTAKRLGHETVAVYADPDREAPFVQEATVSLRLGPAELDASYLNIERLLEAARRSGATAVHPGYGFLSESAAFAHAVGEAGLIWVGPNAQAIEKMGSKIEARGIALAAGVPTIPGFDASQKPADLAAAARRIGYPVLVKAAAGGGGKGIRIVHEEAAFAAALEEAMNEAARNFGDSAVIVERFVTRARHVEVQVVGDRQGGVIDLGTRECSVQRRYQKLLEEAPAPNLPEATRRGLRESARELTRAMAYDSAGTVEFVVDDATGDFYFLEMNTRLQVEHPVTEAITGIDLVELQIRCAEGEPLPIEQADVRFRGHAFEARINAEDAGDGFAPQTGLVRHLRIPADVRWESGIEAGSRITPHYDPMVAKLVVHGPDRDVARRRLASALDELIVAGLVTNTGFHRWLIDEPAVAAGRVTTRFLDENEFVEASDAAEACEVAASAWRAARRAASASGPWTALDTFRLTPHRSSLPVVLRDRHGEVHEVGVEAEVGVEVGSKGEGEIAVDGEDREAQWTGSHLVHEVDGVRRRVPVVVDLAARSVALNLSGRTHTLHVLSRTEHWAPSAAGEGWGDSESIRAPFPAIVTDTPVAAGDAVAAGDVVIVIEAMKMLHSLVARGTGVVAAVHAAVGESVDSNQVLVSFEAIEAEQSGASPEPDEGASPAQSRTR